MICLTLGIVSLSARRAWIEIDIDDKFGGLMSSLSARRAWIEIKYVVKDSDFCGVALRKESVDRNTSPLSISSMILTSLSARRAWIEIPVILII